MPGFNVVFCGLVSLSLLSAGCAPRVIVKHRPGNAVVRVAVLPFKDAPGYPGSGAIATEEFSTAILGIPQYEIIDRLALEQVFKEQQLSLTGAFDESQAVQIGKLLQADAIVVGAVTEYVPRRLLMFPPAKVSVTTRMIDVKTGQVDWSASHRVGGAKRWLTWVVWPVGIVATVISPTATDQVAAASRQISRCLQRTIESPPRR